MRSRLTILIILLLMIVGAGQALSATLVVTPDQIPKGAYVNGGGDDADDNFYWQQLTLTLGEAHVLNATIDIDLPIPVEVGEIRPAGTLAGHVSIGYTTVGAGTASVTGATATTITVTTADLAFAQNDVITLNFPVILDSEATEDSGYYVVDFSDTDTDDIDLGDGQEIFFRSAGALQIADFEDILAADDDSTSTWGEKYPDSAANLFDTLPDFVEDGNEAGSGSVGVDVGPANLDLFDMDDADLDEVSFTLWVYTDSTLSHVNEIESGALHVIDFTWGGNYTMNEDDDGNDGDNGLISCAGLPEGEYWFYITSHLTGDFPLFRSGKLTVLHYPRVEIYGFDWNGDDVFDTVGDVDDENVVLDTGSYFGYDEALQFTTTARTTLDFYVKANDFDDEAQVILFYSTDSSLDDDDVTAPGGVVTLDTATKLVDTLNENQEDAFGFIKWEWDVAPVGGSYIPAETYYVYAVAYDTKHTDLLTCLGTVPGVGFDNVETVTIKHSPDFKFDAWTEYDTDTATVDDIDLNVALHDKLVISWGKSGVDGDKDIDDSCLISFYIVYDTDNTSPYFNADAATILAAVDDLPDGVHEIDTGLAEDPEGKSDSWYEWDIKADCTAPGATWYPLVGAGNEYHLFAIIDENKDNGTKRVVALGDDGLLGPAPGPESIKSIIFTDAGFARLYDPPADGANVTGEQTYRLRFDAFNSDNPAVASKIGIFLLLANNAAVQTNVGGEGPLQITVTELAEASDDETDGVAGAAYCLTSTDGTLAGGATKWLDPTDTYYDLTLRLPTEDDMRYITDLDAALPNALDLPAGTYWVYIGVDDDNDNFTDGTEPVYRAPGSIIITDVDDTIDPPQRNMAISPTNTTVAGFETIEYTLRAADNFGQVDRIDAYIAVEKAYWNDPSSTPFTAAAEYNGQLNANQVIDDVDNNRWILRVTVFNGSTPFTIVDTGLGESVVTFSLTSKGSATAVGEETGVYFVDEPANGWVTKFSDDGEDITVSTLSSVVTVLPRGIIEGIVELQGRNNMNTAPNASATIVTFELRERGGYENVSDSYFYTANEDPAHSGTAGVQYQLDTDGKFTLTKVPTGEYDLVAKYDRYLSVLREVNVYPGVDTLFVSFGILPGGDCVGYTDTDGYAYPDNSFETIDITRIDAAFLATPASSEWADGTNNWKWSDINEDDIVESDDLSMVTANVAAVAAGTLLNGAQPRYKIAIQPELSNLDAIVEFMNVPGELKAGETYTIQVIGRNTTNVRAYFINLNYATDALTFAGIAKGDFLETDTYSFPVIGNETVGLANAVYGDRVFSGDGLLAEVRFTALRDGMFTPDMLGFERISIVNSDFMRESIVMNEPASISENDAPVSFGLDQNFPNPFNPTTTISFSVPDNGNMTLKVYDILGRHVRTLVDGTYSAGNYNIVWDATDMNGDMVSVGVYFYTIQSGNHRATKRMLLLK